MSLIPALVCVDHRRAASRGLGLWAGLLVLALLVLGGCAAKKRALVQVGYQELVDPGLPLRTLDAQQAALERACKGGYRPACEDRSHLGAEGWSAEALGDAAALRCTEKGAAFRDELSCVIAGGALITGTNPGQGVRLLELACLGGEPLGCLMIEDFRRRGRGIARDPATAGPKLAELCDEGAGDARACRVLAQMHAVGDGVPRDLDTAAVLAAAACAEGDVVACGEQGFALRQKGDEAAAQVPLEQACQGGVRSACAVLAAGASPPSFAVAGASRACVEGDLAGCPLALSALPPTEAEQACDAGSAAACTRTGRAMMLGELPWGSFRGGVAAFDKACALGHVPGCTWEARLLDYWGAEPRKVRWLFPYACARGHEDGCIEEARRALGREDEADLAASALDEACKAGDQNACSAYAEGVLLGRVPGDKRAAVSQLQASCAAGGRFGCGTLGKAVLKRSPELGSQFLLVGCGNLERGTCEALVTHHGTGPGPADLTDTGWNALMAQVCEMDQPEACAAWSIARAEGRSVPVQLDEALRGLREACRDGSAQACELADPLSARLNRKRSTFGERQVPQLGVISQLPAVPPAAAESFSQALALGGACVRKGFRREEIEPGRVLVVVRPDGRAEVIQRHFPEGAVRDCLEVAFTGLPVVAETELLLYAGWGAPPSLQPPVDEDGIAYALRFGPGTPEVLDRSPVTLGDVDDRRLGAAVLAAIPFGELTAECPLLGDQPTPQWPEGSLVLDILWHPDGTMGEVSVAEDGPGVPALTSCIVDKLTEGDFWLGRPGATAPITVRVPLEFRQLLGGPIQVGGVTIQPGQ